ncbi:MAG TPA: glycosyltransferase [Mobilitalea sp.]|nr:glycosyltransferase [Mobilitalea sp.]
MKIYYLGSAIDPATMDKITLESKIKPSHAPVYFQRMALKGMKLFNKDIEIHSVPPVKTFPNGNMFCWGRRKEKLSADLTAYWLPSINLQIIKHITIAIATFFSVFWWLIRNLGCKEKILVSYFIYLPYSFPALVLCRLFQCKTAAVITDSIDYSYGKVGRSSLKNILRSMIRNRTLNLKDSFDCYIFLTKYLRNDFQVANKKYIIMEGFCDESSFHGIMDCGKTDAKTVMYAGLLSRDFGINKLVDAFMKMEGNYRLWLFGSGDSEDYIRKCEKKDERIKYRGKVNREELLESELKADLLISVKPSAEEHSKYAFPSKILEYMSSGTPVLSTRVGGIPEEYFNYICPLEDESEAGIISSIKRILLISDDGLREKGMAAREFALNHKNYRVQGERMITLFKECLKINE